MEETTAGTRRSIACLILVPSLITLAVTILRLVGELQQWSPIFFNRAAGGGGAIVGISWLPFLFGPYFALRLSAAGDVPKGRWKALGFVLLGIVVGVGASTVAYADPLKLTTKELVGHVLILGSVVFPFLAWRALAGTLLAYGYAARIPVAIVMFFAIRFGWDTHYSAFPPEFHGPMDFWTRYTLTGLLPQLIAWIWFTVMVGALLGIIVNAIVRRGRAEPRPAP
jgi:hypothetical protein